MERYERLKIVITTFDIEDVITTSGMNISPENEIINDSTAPMIPW